MRSPFEEQEVHLRDYFYILRKRKHLILSVWILILMAGIAFTFFEEVLYQGTATVLIERENPNIVDFKEVMALDASSTEYYRTQYELAKSPSLIRELIEEENLGEDPYLLSQQDRGWRKYLSKIDFLKQRFGSFLERQTLTDLFRKKMLKIKPVRNSRLVTINVLHPDGVRAAEIVNTLVHLFIRKNLKSRYLASKQATQLIADQVVELKEKLGEAERRLQAYKEEHNLVSIPSIRREDEFIQDAKLELVKLQAQEYKLAKRYLPAHPKRIHLHSQIEGLAEKIQEEEQKKLGLGRVAIQYSELERETESAKKIYESLLERLKETHSEAKAQASNILVVDRAVPQTRPYKPRPAVNLFVSFLFGLLMGVVLAYFVEYLDSSIQVPDDVEKGLGLELLGVIPQEERRKELPLGGELFFKSGVNSAAAESLRALRTVLLFKLRHREGCHKILITSPNPEEGKSTIALNLAVAFEQNHLKVLLIDADLRKPRLQRILSLESDRGLTDVLEGGLPLEGAIHANVQDLGFDFLAAGVKRHSPTEILGSKAMTGVMKQFEQNYDLVLFDSPPFLAVADVAVLSEYVDQVVVVAKHQKTDRRHLSRLDRLFTEVQVKGVGVVINQVSARERDYYYHRYYYYGYGDQAPAR